MQRADLVVGAIRHISSRLGANTLISNVKSIYQPDPSDSFVEFRSHPRSCEEWEKEVLEVYTQSSNGDYASQRSRIGRERVHELRAYKDHASDNLFHYLVAEISTNQSPGHCVYMRLRMTISDSSTVTTVVKRLESWPRNDALLVEQTCFTDRLPVLLDLILLGPIVYSMSARYVTIDFEFFFADLILRAFQELFRHTCPRRESRYIDPTFVILETRSTGKQRERCFVLPFRSKLLDEIEPLFARRRREFGLKNTPKPPRFVRATPEPPLQKQDKGKGRETQITISEAYSSCSLSDRPRRRGTQATERAGEGSSQKTHLR